MPDETVVDRLYRDFQELIQGIDPVEVSLRETLRVNFSKSLLLSAASYFEEQVKNQLLDFMRSHSSGNELVMEFIRNKAVERQYHTYFNWGEVRLGSANNFFGLFGNDFKEYMVQYARNDIDYANAILAFLDIGSEP